MPLFLYCFFLAIGFSREKEKATILVFHWSQQHHTHNPDRHGKTETIVNLE